MGQTKVLSKGILTRLAGVSGKQNITVSWHTASFIMKTFLTANEYMDTVFSILDDCKAPDGSIAQELLDFSTRLHIITAYAFVEFPEDMEQIYYIVYNSDLYDTVLKHANSAQVESIITTVQRYASR